MAELRRKKKTQDYSPAGGGLVSNLKASIIATCMTLIQNIAAGKKKDR